MSQISRVAQGSGGAPVETLTGNAGGAVSPSASGNITLTGTAPLTVTGTPGTNSLDITVSSATQSAAGVVELATAAETITGTSTSLSVHPDGLNAKLGTQTSNGLLYGQGGAGSALGSLAAATDGQIPIGSTGSAPVLAQVTGGPGITITHGPGSITVSTDNAGFVWSVLTTGTTAQDNNGYFTQAAGVVSVALPNTSSVGDTFQVCALSAGGWIVTQAASQSIILGNLTTTTGAGGSLASNAQGDWITLVCAIANTTWVARTEQGNITIT